MAVGADVAAAEAALAQMEDVARRYRAAIEDHRGTVGGMDVLLAPLASEGIPFAQSTRQTVKDSFYTKDSDQINTDGITVADQMDASISKMRDALAAMRAHDDGAQANISNAAAPISGN